MATPRTYPYIMQSDPYAPPVILAAAGGRLKRFHLVFTERSQLTRNKAAANGRDPVPVR